jgi:hypothetical protein
MKLMTNNYNVSNYIQRPELVRRNPVPLSSDAMSKFGIHDKSEHDLEVETATFNLIHHIIPTFAYNISR